MAELDFVNWIILFGYLLGVLALGTWIGRGQRDSTDFFLGGRQMPWWAVLLSIVATETSTVTFLSVPGVAFATGGNLTFWQLTLGYILGRFLVVTVLLPSFFQGKPFTAYEVLGERLGTFTRRMASVLFIITRTLADGLRLYLTALVLRAVLDVNLPTCVAVIGVATIIYTVMGGVRSVIWNDCIQFAIYMLGAVIAGAILVERLPGGWSQLVAYAQQQGKFQLLDFSPSITSRSITFWSGLIGGAFLSFASHGADQLMVQRYLTARSRRDASWAVMASGFIVSLQFALFLLIGVGLAAFYATYPPSAPLANDEAFIRFIVENVGTPMVGIILAAVFAAAMSTLSSSLNSSASCLVNDFLLRDAADARVAVRGLWLGRLATLGFGILQMGVAVGTDRFLENQQIVGQVLAIAGFTTGLILGLYLLGLLIRNMSQSAALAGFAVGLAVVSYVAFQTNVSWPWYTVVGTTTTFVAGWCVSLALRSTS